MINILCILEENGIYRLYELDEDIDEMYEWDEEPIEEDDADELTESLKRKVVVRKGKRIRKKVSTKPGYKVINGKEVRMKPGEIRRRKKAQRKGARLRKGKKASANRKRKQSMRKVR